jgi:hypothetical protein
MDVVFTDIQNTSNRIYAKIEYSIWFDKTTRQYNCTCQGYSQFNKECKHIKDFKKVVERIEWEEEVFNESDTKE